MGSERSNGLGISYREIQPGQVLEHVHVAGIALECASQRLGGLVRPSKLDEDAGVQTMEVVSLRIPRAGS